MTLWAREQQVSVGVCGTQKRVFDTLEWIIASVELSSGFWETNLVGHLQGHQAILPTEKSL